MDVITFEKPYFIVRDGHENDMAQLSALGELEGWTDDPIEATGFKTKADAQEVIRAAHRTSDLHVVQSLGVYHLRLGFGE